MIFVSIRNIILRRKKLKQLAKRFPSLSIESNVQIKGPIENFICGKNVQIHSNSVLHLGGMDWCMNKGSLVIGDNSCIANNVTIYAAGTGGVEIGKNFDCGPNVSIFSSRSDYNNRRSHVFEKVRILDNVIIYANCVISPGVTIGKNSVIAAGSVVNDNVPDDVLAGGSPAKVIKAL